jgi:DNA-binding GntR family transcriptional regulator
MQSLGISVYHDIRRDILTARLPPRQKLGLKMLSERYRCGASPIREALNQLTVEGWVRRIDKRGFFVSEVSSEDFEDILNIRCLIEAEALRRSIALGDGAWAEQVVLTHFRLSSIDREADEASGGLISAWEEKHRDFHRALIAACGSRILLDTAARLYDMNIRYRVLARQSSRRVRNVAHEHDEIRDLTLARDADGAVAALVRHYRSTGAFLFPAEADRLP